MFDNPDINKAQQSHTKTRKGGRTDENQSISFTTLWINKSSPKENDWISQEKTGNKHVKD